MPRFGHFTDTTSSLSNRVFSDLVRKARGKSVFPLHVGDIWRLPPERARAEAQRVAVYPKLHNYSPVQGVAELLDAIQHKAKRCYGVELERASIQVTTGATGGLTAACQALVSPGDEVLLPSPFWPLIRGIIKSRGAKAVEVPVFRALSEDTRDSAESLQKLEACLEDKVTEQTAALYINSPHNPTGIVLSKAELEVFGRVAKRHDLWVMVDEAYEDLWFDAQAPTRAHEIPDIQERAVVCHTLSKGYGLAGIRVGYVHGPKEAIARIRSVQTFHYYCAPTPMQYAAAAALEDGDAWLAENRRLFRDAGEQAAQVLRIEKPRGGTFLFFDASAYLQGDAKDVLPFLERLLDAGVLLTPGASCGQGFDKWARLCFSSVEPETFRQALRTLQTVLAESGTSEKEGP